VSLTKAKLREAKQFKRLKEQNTEPSSSQLGDYSAGKKLENGNQKELKIS